MKLYSNIILTVIAFALIIIILQNANVLKKSSYDEVSVKEGELDVRVRNGSFDVDATIVGAAGSLPVTVENIVEVEIY